MAIHSLPAGAASGIGSLPHTDARAAAALVLRCTPELPAAPQLPRRSPQESMLAQSARAVPEVTVAPDGTLAVDPGADADAPVAATFDRDAHAGLAAFLAEAAAAPRPPAAVKVQTTGPLTLAIALRAAGLDPERALARGAEAAAAWSAALRRRAADVLPDASVLLVLDEPGLAAWAAGDGPFERDRAVDVLSSVIASTGGPTGVHSCGSADLAIAIEAGPDLLALPATTVLVDHAVALGRHLEGGGWIAWGVVPTDRPFGESAEPLWRRLVDLWCELTRRGCDPIALRSAALVTPACGLAGHGRAQAEQALTLAREVGHRVHGQAAATKLTVGA